MVARMLAGAVATAVLTAVGSGVAGDTAAAAEGMNTADRAVRANYFEMHTAARFAPPTALMSSRALTYDTTLVPAGARIAVEQLSTKRGTAVRLLVTGLQPGHEFGVHVHQKPCAADPKAAGAHYQNEVDPVQPSTDPKYVNAENEVWLDFTTTVLGIGAAQAYHSWGFRSGEAGSVVIHDAPGSKGARVACFTVPFGAVNAG